MAEEAQDKTPSLAAQWSLQGQEQTDQTDTTVEKKTEDASSTDTGSEDVPVVSTIEAPAAEITSEKGEDLPVVEDTNPVVEDTEEPSAQQEEETQEVEEKSEIKIETAPADFRFPTTNQTRHCFTRYIEYHRCVAAKGEDASECDKFAKYYRSLCPSEWVERWNEQRENGTFPGPL